MFFYWVAMKNLGRRFCYINDMKAILTTFALCLFAADLAHSQMRVIYPENVKPISAPLPSFPEEVRNPIYGDEIRVLAHIDTEGKVKGALAYFPLTPCSNPADPTIETVRSAAVSAARATVFHRILKDGKAIEERVSIGYRLRPVPSSLSDEQRRIVSIGIANGRAIALPKPQYPEAARRALLNGSITVQILIDESGKVISAGSISGHPQFAEPGMIAACLARFRPMTLRNEPAKMLGAISYNFAP
jgi:hypothetical protein